jgi:hypothetical protein
LPNRYILHAVEGWGKTSWGAKTPSPIVIQTKGETGLETLIDAGRLPAVPHFPEAQTWDEVLGYIEALRSQEHGYKTLVMDTFNGAERLMHEAVCHRDFNDEWGDKGFMGYMRGYEVSLADWRQFLSLLDALRQEKRMGIVGLVHTKVKTFKNPEGPDYDRYAPDMHDKTWSLSHKWSDCVLFGNFEVALTAVQENKKTGAARGKAIGGNLRIMYTERHASYDAKNRLGLPSEIEMGDSPDIGWANFVKALKEGRSNGTPIAEESVNVGTQNVQGAN